MRKRQTLKKKQTLKDRVESAFSFKETADLQKEYDRISEIILETAGERLSDYIDNTDTQFFLKNNQLDYNLYLSCIKVENSDYFE